MGIKENSQQGDKARDMEDVCCVAKVHIGGQVKDRSSTEFLIACFMDKLSLTGGGNGKVGCLCSCSSKSQHSLLREERVS